MSDHPSIADLIERSDSPSVREHLDSCASCRARSRLVVDLDDGLAEPEAARISPVLTEAGRRAADVLADTLTRGHPRADDDDDDLIPGRHVDRYVVEGRIGSGGMGTVYRVRHLQLGSHHALKRIRGRWASRSERERLLREGRAQSRLRHPNVVPVTDVVDVDGAPGLIMDLVRGPTLAALLRERGPLDPAQVQAIGEGIVRGVAAAHRAGLVHRDLKPANVLLAETDGAFVPKVADFGLVRALDAERGASATHGPVGTPAYMAPEQIRDAAAADVRSDVFALGAVLYELVSGKRAYDGTSLVDVYERIRSGTRVPLRTLAPDAPAHQVAAIECALQVDPAERFPDCDALLAAWRAESIASLVPEPLRPSEPAETWGPWIPWVAVAGVAAVALLVGRTPNAPVAPVAAIAAVAPVPTVTQDRRITARPDDLQLFSVAVSPDGTEVAYADALAVRRQPIAGGPAITVVEGGPFHDVDWFPDGKRLMVRGTGAMDGIWSVGIDGSDPVRLLDSGETEFVRVSPDGTELALMDMTGLWRVSVADGTRTRVRPLGGADVTRILAWSPSGRSIAAVHQSGANSAWLEVTSSDGRVTRRVVEESRLISLGVAAIAWLPPDRLVYAAAEEHDKHPRLMALDGAEHATDASGAFELRRYDDFAITHLDGSADGSTVVYARLTGLQAPYLLPLDGSAPPREFSREEWNQLPVGWADPGSVYIQSARGSGELVRQPIDGGPGEVVLSDPRIASRVRRVGEDLVFVAWGRDKGRLRLVRAHAGETTDILELPYVPRVQSQFNVWCDTRCLIGGMEGSDATFDWVDLDTGTRTRLPIPGLTNIRDMCWDLSPDGRRLAVATPSADMVIHDLVDGSTESWPMPLALPTELVWSPNGDAVYASGLTYAQEAYQVVEVRQAESRVLHGSMAWFLNRPTPSPDGTTLAFAAARFDDDLWKIEGSLLGDR